ncbi:hypothetical protein SAMN05192560_1610 [Methylobacillus rhizosphaerae]|uniref:Uncharacterized protein n=1 Tax=Methylobacillus rhizosphaerae TaxID=551994 RepID=A0A239A0B6_9PROT|nr:hypothetical protein [Methylobacillus rhizosphaerae]SNR89085.1 hypothetical protein SAMN05192560_1610 [Methylobacillus rhizosphaerae]
MHRYYFIDSSGEDTNLQLYSLKQAKIHWADLQRDLSDADQVEHFHERCIFIICTIGLSVSQLLGQNNPSPDERVPSPRKIFASLVDRHALDPELKLKFKEFIDTYDQCRHFGLTNDGSRHWQVSQVTLDKTRELYEFGLMVWDTVIGIFRRDPQNELDDLDLATVQDEP